MSSVLDRDRNCSADTESWSELLASLASRDRAAAAHLAGPGEYQAAVHEPGWNSEFDRILVARAPEPVMHPDPLGDLRASSRVGTLARYGAAVAIAGFAALLVVAWLPGRNGGTTTRPAEPATGSTDATMSAPVTEGRRSHRRGSSSAKRRLARPARRFRFGCISNGPAHRQVTRLRPKRRLRSPGQPTANYRRRS
jgi:hypothetical protein